MEIRFSHNYPKLQNQTKAHLLCIIKKHRSKLNSDFIEYDTVFTDSNGIKSYFNLPDGDYIVLIFVGNKLIPFTTVRPYSREKWDFYKSNVRKWFDMKYGGR
jgi:hypothetical protein